ncbi:Androgen-dependent TFPI-regulating protein, partial [Galemys pyrenaicus]
MTKTYTCLYHFLVLSWYVFLNHYLSMQAEDPKKLKIFVNGGQWKYLTFLNLLLQTIFYGVVCLEDVLKRVKGKKDIKFLTALRDLLFATLAFPISTKTLIERKPTDAIFVFDSQFVFLSFWSLFLYNRELVYPKTLDDFFPVWFNHAM